MSDTSQTKFYELAVRRVIAETPDARAYTLDVPTELQELFKHRAGQFLTFEIPFEGMQLKRSYSLASSVELGEAPYVVVKRVPDGRISNYFHEQVHVGSVLRVQPPAGRFVLKDARKDAPLLLLAGGSGITPMMALLKTALLSTERNIRLVYANRDLISIIYHQELTRLQARFLDRVEVVYHLDSERGYMTATDVAHTVRGWEDADAYICGPAAWMDVVDAQLQEAGFPSAHVHIERFVSPMDPDRQRPEVAEAMEAAATSLDGPAEAEVISGGETFTVMVQPGESILEAIHREGYEVEHQCEEGYCGCCMARIVEGEVTMPLHDALTESEIEEGWILNCQAHPTTKKVVVDYDAGF